MIVLIEGNDLLSEGLLSVELGELLVETVQHFQTWSVFDFVLFVLLGGLGRFFVAHLNDCKD
jgi:hypothetical protein